MIKTVTRTIGKDSILVLTFKSMLESAQACAILELSDRLTMLRAIEANLSHTKHLCTLRSDKFRSFFFRFLLKIILSKIFMFHLPPDLDVICAIISLSSTSNKAYIESSQNFD
jgi:hypothetical protein